MPAFSSVQVSLFPLIVCVFYSKYTLIKRYYTGFRDEKTVADSIHVLCNQPYTRTNKLVKQVGLTRCVRQEKTMTNNAQCSAV